ncbi:MAG: hypothetical protein AB7N70_10930 [Dehalococcoidia bacterium]
MTSNGNARIDKLVPRVRRMIRRYVHIRSGEKCGIRYEDLDTASPEDRERFREARRRVCDDAFYTMRSARSRQDFVEFFAGSVCSAPQIGASDPALIEALLADDTRWEAVRIMSLMNVSPMWDEWLPGEGPTNAERKGSEE